MEVPISQLSGGNQQKVILGRWLATNPDFLIPVSYTHLDVYKRQVDKYKEAYLLLTGKEFK